MEGKTNQPKILVGYASQTGNTRRVAEAIYSAVPEPKEIKPINEVASLEDYDLSFLGFPVHQMGPDKKARTFLETRVGNRSIALFITHMSPEEEPQLKDWIAKFVNASCGANILGVFNCQGQGSRLVKTIMRLSFNSQMRAWSRDDSSQGQPDAGRLERARAFAAEIMNGSYGGKKHGGKRAVLLGGAQIQA